jgi:arylsulfatase A-like enzyme/tetratricopeptide (TPR) repeat protein
VGSRSKPRASSKTSAQLRSRAIAGAVLTGIVAAAAYGIFRIRDRPQQADLKPIRNQNVLLITVDTLRADALSCYGGPAATPAIDRLASEGVRFDFAHAHAVITLPSHASILTGLYPFQHGIRDNSGYRLGPNARTAAVLLKAAGYATAAFVGAFPVHSRFGLNQGFQDYDDRFGETRAPTEFTMPERPATTVVSLARKWIADRTGNPGAAGGSRTGIQPWFVWVHVFDPHAPYRPPPPFDAQYAGRPYYGEVAATDAALAPLVDDVRQSERPTLVVLTGDHGEALGDHGEDSHGLFAYESTLRIPLIVAELKGRPYGMAGASAVDGEVSHTPARHVDILPTILEGVGQAMPADLPGRSLLAAAERRTSAPRQSYFEAMSAMLNRGWAPLTGVLANREKYIDLPIAERYDLEADAAEASNLAGRSPDRDRSLTAMLRAFGSSPPGERRREDPQAAARLRSLGYVAGSAPAKSRYTEADDPKRLVALDQAIHRGVDLWVARRPAEAVRVYEDVLAQRPDLALAYRHLAFVQWESGAVPAAIGTLQKAVRAGISNADLVTQLGTYLAESGNAADAISLIEPLTTAETVDVDTLNALGIAYGRAGRANDARRIFERMLALDAESVMALENLGALELAREDLSKAQHDFQRAVQLDPMSSQAYAGLGVVALKRGDVNTAIASWRRAVDLDATNYDALYNVATTLAREGRFAEARPYLEQFVRTAPSALYAKDIQAVSAILGKQAR